MKGRRHTVSVLKPTDERIKLEEKTRWEWGLPFQPTPDWNFGRGSKGQSRRETTPSVMIPNPWATSRNCFVPEDNIGKPERWTKFMGWDPTLRDIMLKECVGKKALDERNRRLRERSSIDRLRELLFFPLGLGQRRELLPESYQNAKVKSKRFGPRKKCRVCSGYRECHLEGSTRSDFEAAVH